MGRPRRRYLGFRSLVILLSLSMTAAVGSEREALVVASDFDNPPFASWASGDEPEGFEPDLVRDLARVLDRPVRWKRVPFDTLLDVVSNDEADLIALDPDGATIVIVEVKTRRDDRVRPEENITPTKMYRMARLASRLQQSGPFADRPMRLDAIAIHWPEGGKPDLRHYPNAFESPF